MNAEERARLRALAERGNRDLTPHVLALLDEIDRLTEQMRMRAELAEVAMLGAEADITRLTEDKETAKAAWRSAADRAERAEADLADEKRRHAGLRAGVEALAGEWESKPYTSINEHNYGIGATRGCGIKLHALLSDTTTGGRVPHAGACNHSLIGCRGDEDG